MPVTVTSSSQELFAVNGVLNRLFQEAMAVICEVSQDRFVFVFRVRPKFKVTSYQRT